jgi:hypothetical protein
MSDFLVSHTKTDEELAQTNAPARAPAAAPAPGRIEDQTGRATKVPSDAPLPAWASDPKVIAAVNEASRRMSAPDDYPGKEILKHLTAANIASFSADQLKQALTQMGAKVPADADEDTLRQKVQTAATDRGYYQR